MHSHQIQPLGVDFLKLGNLGKEVSLVEVGTFPKGHNSEREI